MDTAFSSAQVPPRVKVVTGYTNFARFMAECSDEPVREIERIRAIPSPYAFSPVHPVWSWKGREIIVVETRHLRHEVFDVTGIPTAPSEEERDAAVLRRSQELRLRKAAVIASLAKA